jgi:hypothetical protein
MLPSVGVYVFQVDQNKLFMIQILLLEESQYHLLAQWYSNFCMGLPFNLGLTSEATKELLMSHLSHLCDTVDGLLPLR